MPDYTSLQVLCIKWFTMYYIVFGLITCFAGLTLLVAPGRFQAYLSDAFQSDDPPEGIRKLLKYLFLFTIPGFALSFFSPTWMEMLFSLWCFWLVFMLGYRLAHWNTYREAFIVHLDSLQKKLRILGAIMVAAAATIFLVLYRFLELSGQ